MPEYRHYLKGGNLVERASAEDVYDDNIAPFSDDEDEDVADLQGVPGPEDDEDGDKYEDDDDDDDKDDVVVPPRRLQMREMVSAGGEQTDKRQKMGAQHKDT